MSSTRKVEDIITYFGKGVTPKYVDKSSIIVLNQKCIRNNVIDYSFSRFIDDTKEYSGDKLLRRGDVLINSTGVGTAGRVAFVNKLPKDKRVIVDSHILVLRTNNYFESACLNYSLFSRESLLQTFIDGSTGQGEFDKVKLFNIELGFPVLEKDQRKIVAVFSALNNKIELNRKINAELEQMARTLYDYWFVQFDFPDTNGKPYKSSGGQMTYSDQLKREIPAGWKVQDMYNNDLFDIIKPKIDKFAGEKQYIATADVDSLNISKGSPITYENRESRANMQPKEYTVWFAKMKASIKHILVGDYSEDLLQDAIFSTGFMGIQTSKEAFEYVALTVHRPYFELVKDANSNGATMAAIGNNDMKNIKLLVPSPDVITSFHEAVRPILQKIDLNRQQSQKLAELRDWLLPMLMNGQVSVR